MKLSSLLTKDQILLDTNLNYAEILRLKTDGKNEYFTFRPSEVLNGAWDFDLGPRDVIKLVKVGYSAATQDFDRFVDAVQLSGPVQFAGFYAWRDGMKLSSLLALAKPSIQTNQVYAEIVRPLGGNKFEYLTFAPREIASGAFDVALKARDTVKLYTTVPVVTAKQGAETAAEPTTAALAPAAAAASAVLAAPSAPTPVVAVSPAPQEAAPVASSNHGDQTPTDLGRFLEIVAVSGSVRYVGPYARTPSLRLSSVVTADQILEETNLDYAELTRLKADGSYEYLTFVPKDILEGKFDLALRARDSIRFVKKTVFGGALAAANVEKFADLVQLTGQIARPEIFALGSGLKLSKLLTKDQILLDTNQNYAEILRLKADGKNEYFTFRPSEVLDGTWDFDLGARDIVRFVKVGYATEAPDLDRFVDAVQLSGPVQFAGLYTWRDGMKLSALLALAKPSIQTNQVYAEIVRPLGGSKFEYLTFAPREIAAGTFDIALKARDAVKLYTTAPAVITKQGAEVTAEPTTATPTPAATAAAPAPAATAVLAIPATPAPMAVASPATQAAAPVASSNLGDQTPTDLGRFLEIVAVSGSVRYTGPYARTPSLRLSSVVTADQILEETNLDYAELTRLKADGSYEYATFAPKDVLEGKFNLALRARDSIRFVKKTAFGGTLVTADVEKFSDLVQLTGQVARPEVFAFKPGMKLSQLLTKDQILLDTNLNYAEILRLKTDGKNEYLTFRPSEVLSGAWDFDLGQRDSIRLVKVGYSAATQDFDRFIDAVQLSGPVQFAGLYAWRDGMKLTSLLALAKPSLQTNQVYAEIVRPLGGNKFEYLTFAPREVAAGTFNIILKARDAVKLYTTVPAVTTKQGPEVAAEPPAAAPAVVAAPAPVVAASSGLGDETPADLNRFLEIVTISGSVRYAGPYARTPTLRLSSVVAADQILEETNLDYAELTRLKADGSYEFATFAPKDVLEGSFDWLSEPGIRFAS